MLIVSFFVFLLFILQRFDAVGWLTGSASSRDVRDAFLVETEVDRDLEARDRGRDQGVDNSSRGETETTAV